MSTKQKAYQHNAKKGNMWNFYSLGDQRLIGMPYSYSHLHRCVSLYHSHSQMSNDSRRLWAPTVVGYLSRRFVPTSAHPELSHEQITLHSASWRRCAFQGSFDFCVDDPFYFMKEASWGEEAQRMENKRTTQPKDWEGARAASLSERFFQSMNNINRITSTLDSILVKFELEKGFRVPGQIFGHTWCKVVEANPLFRDGKDCTVKKSCFTEQKWVGAVLQLTHTAIAAFLTSAMRLSESPAHHCRQRFAAALCRAYESEYLRRLLEANIRIVMPGHAKLGFSGALRGLECAEWKLHKRTVAKQHCTTGKSAVQKMRLECVADDRMRIWHLVFGYRGTVNDINITDCFSLLYMVRARTWQEHKLHVTIARRVLEWFYWVVEFTYPSSKIFAGAISQPKTKKEKRFPKSRETFRKFSEGVFRVPLSRWHILERPSRLWGAVDIDCIVRKCVI